MRAKFLVHNISDSKQSISDPENPTKPVEKDVYTISMFPVYANRDGSKNDENSRYWEATPAGSIQLSVVNKAAVDALGIKQGDEVYVDFTKA